MSDESRGEWPVELGLDDAAGPAPYMSSSARDAMVQRVLEGASLARPSRSRWALRSVAALLLVCIGGGSASAAVLWWIQSRREPTVVQPPAQPTRDQAARPVTTRAEAPAAAAPDAPAAPEVQPAVRTQGADDWFREANRLRRARRWRDADEAYGRAARHAASRDTAYVAYVASAGVRLEHLRDARGALARYRAALESSPRGALDEEIRLGIADAYRALGDRRREDDALRELLRLHPDSPLAAQARARLQ
jgi:tetratricopeptide (TPR) repeat protein